MCVRACLQALAVVGLCVMVLSTTVILQAEMNRSGDDSSLSLQPGRRPHPKPPALLPPPPPPPPHSDQPLPVTPPFPENRPPDEGIPPAQLEELVNPVKPGVPDNPPQKQPDERVPPAQLEELVKPGVPDNPPQKQPDERVPPAQLEEPVNLVQPDHKEEPKPRDPQDSGIARNQTVGVAPHVGGGAPQDGGVVDGAPKDGGVTAKAGGVKGVGKDGGVAEVEGAKDMQSLQQGMSQLQSRLNNLEKENQDLKERQNILEQIQVDDLLKKPEVLDEVGRPPRGLPQGVEKVGAAPPPQEEKAGAPGGIEEKAEPPGGQQQQPKGVNLPGDEPNIPELGGGGAAKGHAATEIPLKGHHAPLQVEKSHPVEQAEDKLSQPKGDLLQQQQPEGANPPEAERQVREVVEPAVRLDAVEPKVADQKSLNQTSLHSNSKHNKGNMRDLKHSLTPA